MHCKQLGAHLQCALGPALQPNPGLSWQVEGPNPTGVVAQNAGSLTSEASEPPPAPPPRRGPWRPEDKQNSDSKAHPTASTRPPALLAKAARNSCLHSKTSHLQKIRPSCGDPAPGQGLCGDPRVPSSPAEDPSAPGQASGRGTLKKEQRREEGKASLRIQNEKMKRSGWKEAFQRTFHPVPVPAQFERLGRDGDLGRQAGWT